MTLNAYNNHTDGLVMAVNTAATTAVKKCEEAVQTITSTSTSTIDNINTVKQEAITTVTDNSNKASETIKTLTDTTISNAESEANRAESEANRAESEANRAQHLADKVDVSQYAMPVGFEALTTNPNLQAGWLPLLGGEYSRTAYADLWAWVHTQSGYLLEESAWQAKAAANGGNVPFYSKGDGSTTFRVPALKCWVKGAGNISEVGSYLEAQYPNTEHYHAIGYNTGSNSGRFIATNETQKYNLPYGGGSRNWNGSGGGGGFSTDTNSASQANMITSLAVGVEDSSGTVSPPSIVGLWVVKAYGTVTNVGSTDVANISTGLTQAETRINALETSKVDKAGNAWVVETYRNGTEWCRVWSDGWLEQGYTVSASAWTVTRFTFMKAYSDTDYTVALSRQSTDKTEYTCSVYAKETTYVDIMGQGGTFSIYTAGKGA